jgi:hypothetical protein
MPDLSDAAIRALERGQAASERRIAGLEEDMRNALDAREEAAGGGDAEFHQALATFRAIPHAKTKAGLQAEMDARGLTTIDSRLAFIQNELRRRGRRTDA